MMHNAWMRITTFFLLASIPACLFAQKLNIRLYNKKDGLPQNQSQAICQDTDGYIWVGTYRGITRFNGRKCITYSKRDGLNRNTVTALERDTSGRLWVGMRSGGFNIFENEKVVHFPDQEKWSYLDVQKIRATKDGTVWIISRQGLLRIKGTKTRLFTKADGLPDDHCQAVWEREDSVVMVGTTRGIAHIEGDQVIVPPSASRFKDASIKVILGHDDGRFFLGTDTGLYTLDGTFIGEKTDNPPVVQCGVKAPDGTLWFGTTAHGLISIQGNTLAYMAEASGLVNPHILAVYVDQENNLWIGSDDGLERFTVSPFSSFNSSHGMTHDFARSLYIDEEQVLWVGTRQGVNQIRNGTEISVFDTSKFVNERVFDISQTPTGTMLFGTDGGLVTYRDGKVRNWTEYGGKPLLEMRLVFRDSKGRIWLGTDRLIEMLDEETLRFPPKDSILDNIRIINVKEGQDGWLWLGAFDGLYAYHPDLGETRNFTNVIDLAVWEMDFDLKGNLWIGTNGLGLFKYDGKEFTNFSTETGFGDDYVWQIQQASNGDLWVGHSNGLIRYQGESTTLFDTNDGLASDEGSATCTIEDASGSLWFGTALGLTHFNPRLEIKKLLPPLVHLEKVLVNDLEVAGPRVDLPRRNNTLTFQYTGLSYGFEDRVQYSYQLKGHDEDWSKPTSVSEAIYRSLPKGDFQFLLKARCGDGEWSEVFDNFSFTIRPFFWETLWFRVLIGLIVLALIAAFFRLKNLALRKKNLELSALVAERTKAVEEKNDELRVSEQRSRAIFEQADVSIVLFNRKSGALEEFNDKAHLNLGYSRDELEKLTVHDVLAPEARVDFEDYLQQTDGSEPHRIETIHLTKEGTPRDVVASSRTITIHDVEYILGIWRDVTEQKNVQNQLMVADKMASLGRLTAGIAHEMNTPIAAVRTSLAELSGLAEEYTASVGNAEVTDEDHLEIAKEMIQAIELAKKAATRAAAFVQSTKSQTRNLETREARLFKMETVVSESLMLLSHALRAGNSQVVFENADDGLEMFGAPGWLAQVVTNLVTNAIDANADKGGGKIIIHLEAGEKNLLLSVSDEGSGIEPELQAKIFDPMFTTKPFGEGTGLGLTIVHDIITGQLGGTISVDSEPNKGTTFLLRFPKKKEKTHGPN